MLTDNTAIDVFDLSGHVAVVTGASSGIGVQMALAMARKGADIALLARREGKLEAIAADIRKLGVKCEPYKCDVTSTEMVNEVAKKIKEDFGTVHILVNNAGGLAGSTCVETTDDDWNFLHDLNVASVFKVCRAFAPMMIEQKYGRVVNISSIAGLVGGATSLAYHTTKGAVVNMTRSLAAEWAEHNVTANAICPGPFMSELTEPLLEQEEIKAAFSAKIPMKRIGDEGELDSSILFFASKKSGYVTGVSVAVDGGWCAV
ncbi:hypothetical protein GEMRC1_006714 [Eukaryota sp. GEM-RC1]